MSEFIKKLAYWDGESYLKRSIAQTAPQSQVPQINNMQDLSKMMMEEKAKLERAMADKNKPFYEYLLSNDSDNLFRLISGANNYKNLIKRSNPKIAARIDNVIKTILSKMGDAYTQLYNLSSADTSKDYRTLINQLSEKIKSATQDEAAPQVTENTAVPENKANLTAAAQVQESLNKLYPQPPVKVNGVFRNDTLVKIKQFLKDNNKDFKNYRNSFFNPNLWAEINNAAASQVSQPQAATPQAYQPAAEPAAQAPVTQPAAEQVVTNQDATTEPVIPKFIEDDIRRTNAFKAMFNALTDEQKTYINRIADDKKVEQLHNFIKINQARAKAKPSATNANQANPPAWLNEAKQIFANRDQRIKAKIVGNDVIAYGFVRNPENVIIAQKASDDRARTAAVWAVATNANNGVELNKVHGFINNASPENYYVMGKDGKITEAYSRIQVPISNIELK